MGRIVVETGRSVPVGELIAIITQQGETLPPVHIAHTEETASAAESAPSSDALPAPSASNGTPPAPGEVRASPIARRLARERGIDLTRVTGSGPNGRIVEADILSWHDSPAGTLATEPPSPQEAPPADTAEQPVSVEVADAPETTPVEAPAAQAPVPEPAPAPSPVPITSPASSSEPLSRMRQAIARVTTQSKREAPHFYVTADIDMTQAMALRRQINESLPEGQRVTVNDLVVKAVAMTLQSHPRFNASFREDRLEFHAAANIGIAIALEQGLIIAAVPNCQDRSLIQIAQASRDLVQRAEGGTLRAEEYESTFSISNMGMYDVDSFSAIIYPPNAAVLAVASVKERPVVREGQLAVAQMMSATLSVDHRVADGAEAARFLVDVKTLLEQPVKLLF